MDSLFLLQFSCVIITVVLAFILAVSRMQVRWLNRRYEQSRWLLFLAMLILAVHYSLQMSYGLRAGGDDIGAVVNVLFYTPVSFIFSYAVYNLEYEKKGRKRFVWISIAGYMLVIALFVLGWQLKDSLRLGSLLYVMVALYGLCMVIFISVPMKNILNRRDKIENSTGTDIIPYVSYIWISFTMLCMFSIMMIVTVLYRPMLFVIGPLILVSIIMYILSFVALGYNLEPLTDIIEGGDTDYLLGEEQAESNVMCDASDKENVKRVLTEERSAEIKRQLDEWCHQGGFRDSAINMSTLSRRICVSRRDLSLFFDQQLHSSFRVWLSEIRVKEAQRMLIENPNYSNDTISAECGFSSHAHLYRVFKAKVGMTPGKWRDSISIPK